MIKLKPVTKSHRNNLPKKTKKYYVPNITKNVPRV